MQETGMEYVKYTATRPNGPLTLSGCSHLLLFFTPDGEIRYDRAGIRVGRSASATQSSA